MTPLFGVPIPEGQQVQQTDPLELLGNLRSLQPNAGEHTYVEHSGKHKGVAGVARDILGTLGDFLLTRLHMPAMYGPGQQQRKLNAAWQGHDIDPQAALDRVTDVNFEQGNKLRNTYADNARADAAQASTAETREGRLAIANDLKDQSVRKFTGDMLESMSGWDEAKRVKFYPQVRDRIISAGKRQGYDLSEDLPEQYSPETAPIIDAFISGAVPVATQRQQVINQQKADETGKHNRKTEDQGDRKLAETETHDRATEGVAQQRADTGSAAQSETVKHNRTTEGIGQQRADQTGAKPVKGKPTADEIQYLRENPDDSDYRAKFDARYGLGASKKGMDK